MLFDELLEKDNFSDAVEALARDKREELDLPPIHQLGLVVPDAVAAAKDLEARGIGPFFIASGAPVLWRERGEEIKFKGKLGMSYYKGIELELLEPGQGSDFYRRRLDPEGRIVVQHLGMLAEDVDKWAVPLVSQGYPIYVRGCIKTGPMTTDFAYMDTEESAGFVLEFISWKVFGRNMGPPARFMNAIARLQKLTGLRTLPA